MEGETKNTANDLCLFFYGLDEESYDDYKFREFTNNYYIELGKPNKSLIRINSGTITPNSDIFKQAIECWEAEQARGSESPDGIPVIKLHNLNSTFTKDSYSGPIAYVKILQMIDLSVETENEKMVFYNGQNAPLDLMNTELRNDMFLTIETFNNNQVQTVGDKKVISSGSLESRIADIEKLLYSGHEGFLVDSARNRRYEIAGITTQYRDISVNGEVVTEEIKRISFLNMTKKERAEFNLNEIGLSGGSYYIEFNDEPKYEIINSGTLEENKNAIWELENRGYICEIVQFGSDVDGNNQLILNIEDYSSTGLGRMTVTSSSKNIVDSLDSSKEFSNEYYLRVQKVSFPEISATYEKQIIANGSLEDWKEYVSEQMIESNTPKVYYQGGFKDLVAIKENGEWVLSDPVLNTFVILNENGSNLDLSPSTNFIVYEIEKSNQIFLNNKTLMANRDALNEAKKRGYRIDFISTESESGFYSGVLQSETDEEMTFFGSGGTYTVSKIQELNYKSYIRIIDTDHLGIPLTSKLFIKGTIDEAKEEIINWHAQGYSSTLFIPSLNKQYRVIGVTENNELVFEGLDSPYRSIKDNSLNKDFYIVINNTKTIWGVLDRGSLWNNIKILRQAESWGVGVELVQIYENGNSKVSTITLGTLGNDSICADDQDLNIALNELSSNYFVRFISLTKPPYDVNTLVFYDGEVHTYGSLFNQLLMSGLYGEKHNDHLEFIGYSSSLGEAVFVDGSNYQNYELLRDDVYINSLEDSITFDESDQKRQIISSGRLHSLENTLTIEEAIKKGYSVDLINFEKIVVGRIENIDGSGNFVFSDDETTSLISEIMVKGTPSWFEQEVNDYNLILGQEYYIRIKTTEEADLSLNLYDTTNIVEISINNNGDHLPELLLPIIEETFSTTVVTSGDKLELQTDAILKSIVWMDLLNQGYNELSLNQNTLIFELSKGEDFWNISNGEYRIFRDFTINISSTTDSSLNMTKHYDVYKVKIDADILRCESVDGLKSQIKSYKVYVDKYNELVEGLKTTRISDFFQLRRENVTPSSLPDLSILETVYRAMQNIDIPLEDFVGITNRHNVDSLGMITFDLITDRRDVIRHIELSGFLNSSGLVTNAENKETGSPSLKTWTVDSFVGDFDWAATTENISNIILEIIRNN